MFKIHISHHFKKQLKPHTKKHRSLLGDVINVLKTFKKEQAVYLGDDTYKIRISPSGFHKGKSHAYRLIVLLVKSGIITPLTIYFKGDRETISKEDLWYHTRVVIQELKQELNE